MTKINDLNVVDGLNPTDKLVVWRGSTQAIIAQRFVDYVLDNFSTTFSFAATGTATERTLPDWMTFQYLPDAIATVSSNPLAVSDGLHTNRLISSKVLNDFSNNVFGTDLNRSAAPNTSHYQLFTMRGSDLQQNASQNFVRWLFRDDGVTGGAAYGSGRVAQRFDYYLRGESNTGFMVAQNINLACSNLTGGTQLTQWITSMSPPSATLAATYGLPSVTYGWTAGIVSCGEYNFGNRFADFGVLENVTSGRCVFGIFLVPDITDTDDGISVGDIVASGEIYHAQFGLVVSKSTRGHKVYAPFHVAYDTIGPLGYGLLINGNQSSAVDQGSLVFKAQGYFGSGIDMSGCTFSETFAIRIPVGKRIRYSGSQYIGMTGTENGIFNGTASIKTEQNARVIITSASDVVIIGNLDIRNDIINATNDVLFTTEGGVRFPSYTSAQLQDITNAVNTSPVKVAGFTVFNTTLGLLCTAIGSNDNSPWSPSDGGTDLTPT